MKITCYGPRGSLPSPSRKGFDTTLYGGNTSCYYVEAGPFRVILDNGSGIAVLGDDLMRDLLVPQVRATGRMGMHFIALISHYHWDHIQGLPFCVPYFLPGNVFHIHGHAPSGYEGGDECEPRTAVEKLLSEQQANPHFPVAHECLPASRRYTAHHRQFSQTVWYAHCIDHDGDYYMADSEHGARSYAQRSNSDSPENLLKITTIPLNHPDGCLGYRIEYMGKVAVYCTDNEPLRHPNAQITKHGKGADWLLLDGQYTEEQLSGMSQTFGHGTPRACVAQAAACGAGHLVVHHHDPKHDDATVALMETDAVSYGTACGFKGVVQFAREGEVWVLI